MAHRKLKDTAGREWDVWEVNPASIDRRMRDLTHEDDRRFVDTGFVGRVSDRLRHGWLAFQTKSEKRRLTPIPSGWEKFSDGDLLRLLERAQSAGRPSRLIE